ncbi:carbohydrate ABC transporter permease [Chelatococcus asaccharovorans]|uniref:Multiple sugar transport system permease protein/alpha-1,4-digalacturonate transport system permease protein n=1 Tax=Chelatococcus asaccharovorans TaxID=28210 RepID=A0A2V3TXW3_9HYPH|nr:carbohydrate ABC transporter permease [Chelatococcus asaccharovorans]MBS7706820.1 carbohydrate ABC transporter permease [Chelatococcus asaccharovorans]PXW54034.1 multiple sugar transport system permease protein/alpha-1,4-digalacturonate transport system permease protein [Chelatococcus asaccharovorans]
MSDAEFTAAPTSRPVTVILYAVAILIAAIFIYPFFWMVVSSFRTQEAILSAPMRLLPEHFDTTAFKSLATIGGTALSTFAWNSVLITVLATTIGVGVMGLGAYALYRNPRLPLFTSLRYGFLLTIMYPNMLLVIPLYFVSYKLGLLGSTLGIVLVMSLVPLVFFIFVQFFRTIPHEMIEAARIDGAGEWQILRLIILPIARPVILTAVLIAFLMNWKQWFPIMVLSTSPNTYTLPVALAALNSEYGVDFQATMALATITVVPVVVLFLATQRRVMGSFMAGAVKG